ncbi:MAG: hypothetical protein PHD95_02080 [Candidatus ainarchaeum sp.]|nr:hypothetical protein [Candidatus ainarchaeum sp.]
MSGIKQPIMISRIEVLVHPFFTLICNRDSFIGDNKKQVKKKIEALAKQWGREIQLVASDPSAILVVMPTYKQVPVSNSPNSKLSKWSALQLKKLLVFAKKTLGNRLFAFSTFGQLQSLENAARKKGFVFDKKALRGRAFGEYLDLCVQTAQEVLCKGLGIGVERIPVSRRLGVEGVHDYFEFKTKPPAKKKRASSSRRRPV